MKILIFKWNKLKWFIRYGIHKKNEIKGNKVGGFIRNIQLELFRNKIDSWKSKMAIIEQDMAYVQSKQRQRNNINWRRSGLLIVNFEEKSHLALIYNLLWACIYLLGDIYWFRREVIRKMFSLHRKTCKILDRNTIRF